MLSQLPMGLQSKSRSWLDQSLVCSPPPQQPQCICSSRNKNSQQELPSLHLPTLWNPPRVWSNTKELAAAAWLVSSNKLTKNEALQRLYCTLHECHKDAHQLHALKWKGCSINCFWSVLWVSVSARILLVQWQEWRPTGKNLCHSSTKVLFQFWNKWKKKMEQIHLEKGR